MLVLFERDAPDLIEEIGIAVDEGDAQGLRTNAHTLKGMLTTICAGALIESADTFETFGPESRPAEAAEVLEELERQMTELWQELSSYYDHRSHTSEYFSSGSNPCRLLMSSTK